MIKDLYVFEVSDRSTVRDFIEEHHYSHNINGLRVTYSFLLRDKRSGEIVGAMTFGGFGMAGVWRKYGEREVDVLELNRLVLIDDTPKNTESFFIGAALRWLKRNTLVKTIISYADPNYGHEGVVYKASNFEYMGKTTPTRVIFWQGRKYHDKTIRAKYKGVLKPYAVKVREALSTGEAYYVYQEPKNIYRYVLRA